MKALDHKYRRDYMNRNEEIIDEIGIQRVGESKDITYPYQAQIINNDEILICQEKGKTAYLIDKTNEVIWEAPKRINGKLVMLTNLRFLQDKSILCIEKFLKQVIKLNKTGEVIWSYKYSNDFEPAFVDSLVTGEIFILDRSQNRVIVLGNNKSVLWTWQSEVNLHLPWSVHPINLNEFLITDCERHHVIRVKKGCGVIWRFGETNKPGGGDSHLCFPHSSQLLKNGNILISDALNHRVIEVSPEKKIVWKYDCKYEAYWYMNDLNYPTWAEEFSHNKILIVDRENHRVLIINREREIIWESKKVDIKKRLFNSPRSIQVLDSGNLLISDTMNNRVLQMNKDNKIVWEYPNKSVEHHKNKLHWPRSTIRTKSGDTIIADALNSRLVIIDSKNKFNEINSITWNDQSYNFEDPHAIIMLKNTFLVVDSNANFVADILINGTVKWFFKESNNISLSDPHYAIRTRNGDTLICDTGNHRILSISPAGCINWIKNSIIINHKQDKLRGPRFMHEYEDRSLLILDCDNNRILHIDNKFNLLNKYQPMDPILKTTLKNARWIKVKGEEILLSDTAHHRILKMKLF